MLKEINLSSGTIFKYEEYCPPTIPDCSDVVMFIHGANQTSFCWRQLIDTMDSTTRDKYVLLSVNLTGFGKTIPGNTPQVDFNCTVNDLHLFYEYYTSTKSVSTWKIIAFSFGTYVTINWYVDNMSALHNIKSIMLCAPYGFCRNLGKYGYLIGLFIKYKIVLGFYRFIEYIKSGLNQLPFIRFNIHKYIINQINHSYDIISSTFHWSIFQFYIKNPLMARISEVQIPLCFVYGERDIISPYVSDDLSKYQINMDRVHVLTQAGHVFIRRNEFKLLLEHYLDSLKD